MTAIGQDSLRTRRTLSVDGKDYGYYSLVAAAEALGDISRLPFSMKVLFENLLRFEDGATVTVDDLKAMVQWAHDRRSDREIAYRPARVLMQDFTGVPCVVDLAAMRDAITKLGGDPTKINPQVPVDLVIDHSVMVDEFGTPQSFEDNMDLEYKRNIERYEFLRWGSSALKGFRVVPPGTGICHQVNLEYLAQTVWTSEAADGGMVAYPDTLVGTDSHTTMVNALGVLGWGVGGIEAEAAMLGQPVSDVDPRGRRHEAGRRAGRGCHRDRPRAHRDADAAREGRRRASFVEFYGPGLDALTLADRATIANMAPEYGATCGFFPVDAGDAQLSETDRPRAAPDRARRGLCQGAQGMWRDVTAPDPGVHRQCSTSISRASSRRSPGPKPPAGPRAARQRRRGVRDRARRWLQKGPRRRQARRGRGCQPRSRPRRRRHRGDHQLHQHVEPERAGRRRPAGAEGTRARADDEAVGEDLARPRLARWSPTISPRRSWVQDDLDYALASISSVTAARPASATRVRCPSPSRTRSAAATSSRSAVLSGNRNFEGRVSPDVRANYLASPPLVVAYALAGTMRGDMITDPLGQTPPRARTSI